MNQHGTRTVLGHPSDKIFVAVAGMPVIEKFACPLFAVRHVHYRGYGLELFLWSEPCEVCGREWYRDGEDQVNGRCSDCRPDLTVQSLAPEIEPEPRVWVLDWAEPQAPCVCGSTNHATWNCPWYQDRLWGARP